MSMIKTFLPLLLALPFATAHYELIYPYWRGDSNEEPASQWIWPCANINQTIPVENRTEWPLSGGAIAMDVTHDWAFTYINIALGNEVEKFNQSLVPVFNQTGEGNFCLPSAGADVLAELGVTDGMNATLQVIQLSMTGNALYNCADITLSADAESFPDDQCFNSTGVGGVAIANVDEECAADHGGDSADMDMDMDMDAGADAGADAGEGEGEGADADAASNAEEPDSADSAEPATFTGASGKTFEAGSMLMLAVSSIFAAALAMH